MHGKREPLNLSYPYDDLSQMVAGSVLMRVDTLQSLTGYYENVTTDDIISGDGSALQ